MMRPACSSPSESQSSRFLLYIGASDILPEAHREGSSIVTVTLTILGTLFAFGVTRLA